LFGRLRFLVDNNLAPAIARGLNGFSSYKSDIEVVHLRYKFEASTPDPTWLEALGSEGDWYVLSGDYKITKKPHERAAWLASSLTCFFLKKGWMTQGYWEQPKKLVNR